MWQGKEVTTLSIIDALEQEQMKQDVPNFRGGDAVRVHVKVVEGSNERIQVFEGIVLRRMGKGINEMFTVRKISQGVGVERTFPIHSPRIAKIEVIRRGKVRRSRLYYLRQRSGRSARIRERRYS